MKIAITADCHLTTQEKNPERFNAVRQIIKDCTDAGIDRLIFAGDLFDQDTNNPAQFEGLFNNISENLKVLILPGNHDVGLTQSLFTHPAIRVVKQVESYPTNDPTRLLLIPYKTQTMMGDQIAEILAQGEGSKFTIISHGDWLGSKHTRNNYEPGSYMPLLAADINQYQPVQVILGHIHIPASDGRVHYTGSPCGLDITESGKRSYIIYDTATETITRQSIETDIIFLYYKLSIYPHDTELDMIKNKVVKLLEKDEINNAQFPKVKLRLEIAGCSQNRAELKTACEGWLTQLGFKIEKLDLENLQNNDDPTLRQLAELVSDKIDAENYYHGEGYPTKEEILAIAMDTLYKGKL